MKIAVIGNGVIGLTTAIKLLQSGKDVIIYTKDENHKRTEDTVSLVACALWQPYKLFTNLDSYSSEKFETVKRVSLNSLEEFEKNISFDGSKESGIYERKHYEYSTESIYKNGQLKKDFYYIDLLKEFWESKGDYKAIFEEVEISNPFPFQGYDENNQISDFSFLHGYKTYIVDSYVFLNYLTAKFKTLGGKIINKKINLNELKKLKEKVIFNCTGNNGFSIIYGKNNPTGRTIKPKKGALLLYNLKNEKQYENTIVLDELTILCREKVLTIGTGEVKEGEQPDVLINRLIKNSISFKNQTTNDKFNFDNYIKEHKIDISKPDNTLIGNRPYLPDGQGYVLNRQEHKIKNKPAFVIYNNFGHGGSGVTLCWGSAIEVLDLYDKSILENLLKINPKRNTTNICNYSIEIAHYDIEKLKNISIADLDEIIRIEKQRALSEINKLNLNKDSYTLSVLIDDKEAKNDTVTIEKLVKCLNKYEIDFIAYESKLNFYIGKLKAILPENIYNDFSNSSQSHYKLSCSQDIFMWYCLRFGLINFEISDEVIKPISERAKLNPYSFICNTAITILDKNLEKFENKADELLTKSFGYEIPTIIKRIYF